MFENYEDLITVEELQQLLDIGKNTAYQLLNDGTIKSFRIGCRWKIPKLAVEEYIRTQSNLKKS